MEACESIETGLPPTYCEVVEPLGFLLANQQNMPERDSIASDQLVMAWRTSDFSVLPELGTLGVFLAHLQPHW